MLNPRVVLNPEGEARAVISIAGHRVATDDIGFAALAALIEQATDHGDRARGRQYFRGTGIAIAMAGANSGWQGSGSSLR